MRNIILDMQSSLYAKAIRRMLVQDLDGYRVVISESPGVTARECRMFKPYALLMEVTGYSPWTLDERMKICDEVRKEGDECKIIIIVDEVADSDLAGRVKEKKKEGLIDAFLFTSATEDYLVAVMDSL